MRISGISTDTRTLTKGCLFVALKGKNFDGNNFIGEALNSGAVAAITSRRHKGAPPRGVVIRVRDTLKVLGDLAAAWRARFPVKVVCITGSNGKTTTKEMTAAVLSEKFSVLSTEGNLNNLIGVPQMLFRLDSRHEVAVIELGTSRFGEIDRLSEITSPDVGLITNIGAAHLEYFKNLNGVLKEKSGLARHLTNKTLIYNGDDALLRRGLKGFKGRLVSFGFSSGCDVRCTYAEEIGKGKMQFLVKAGKVSSRFCIGISGQHNIYNALGAITLGMFFGLSFRDIDNGLRKFSPAKNRWETIKINPGAELINDSYNANPSSMDTGLREINRLRAKRRIAILGDMLELGSSACRLHKKIGRLLAELEIDRLITIGTLGKFIAEGALNAGMDKTAVSIAGSIENAADILKKTIRRGDLVYVKGSRAVQMERIIDLLEKE